MADTTASTSAADTGASQAGAGTNQQQLTDLVSAIQDLQAKFTSLTENVNKVQTAVAENANLQTTVQGVSDPYENVRRDRLAYDTLMTDSRQGANALAALMLNNFDLVMKQHIRMVDLASSGHWNVHSAGVQPQGGATAPKTS